MTLADLATEGAFFLALAAGLGVPGYVSLRQDTRQLRHNGGSHVADYAMEARDNSRRTLEALQVHLVESARKNGEQDALLQVLLERTS